MISSRTPEGSPNRCPVCGSAVTIEPSDPAGEAPCPNCGHLLWFTWDDAGDVVVIKPKSRLLLSEDLETLTAKAAERRGVKVVLDLCNVQYMSSDALARLINLKKSIMGVRGKMQIRHLHPDMHEIFRICRLDQVFDIEP